MGERWDQFLTNLGNQSAPFGFAPGVDPKTAGMNFIGGIGTGMLANITKSPLEAFGASYQQQMADSRGHSRDALSAKIVMDQVEEKKRERAKQQELEAQFEQYVMGLPPDQQALARFGKDAYMKAQIEKTMGTGDGAEYGLNPIWGTGPDGQPMLFQTNKSGGAPAQVQFPEGFTPEPGVQFLDNGLGYIPANRRTGLPQAGAPQIPKDVFGEAAFREGGKQSQAVPAQVVQDYLKPNGVKEQDDATIASITAIHEARKMLEKGIQTGALADKLQSLRSIGYALGFEVDERVLTDTQVYQNFIRQTVIPKMKELGGNDSNEELRKMEILSGADITQQDAAIRATLDLTEKLMAKKFKSRELYRKATKKYFGDTYEIPELPVYDNGGDGGWTVLPNGVKIRRKGQ
jgi:hypothetical protein